jgi:dolichyl-diphosphooligosaccharide--protein glycosyltransferase
MSILNNISGLLGKLSFLRPRVDRKQLLEYSLLLLIIVVAILFRIQKVQYGTFLDANDPLFQYRVTEYIVENGYNAFYTWHDNLSWYPMGRDISATTYPGIPFSAALVYQTLHFFGSEISLYDTCLYFPVLMGAITIMVMYFMGKEIGGPTVGLFSAAFLAISVAFLRRTGFGFFDTENIGLFGFTATLLFILKAISEENGRQKRGVYAVFAGLSLGYIFASWGAARYGIGILIVYIIGAVVTNLYSRRILEAVTISSLVGLIIAVNVEFLGGFSYITNAENMALLILVGLLWVYELMKTQIEIPKARYIMLGLIVVSIIGVLVLQSLNIIKPITGKFLSVLIPNYQSGLVFGTVAEHKVPTWTLFYTSFGIAVPFAILGGFFALRNLTDKHLLGVSLFSTSLYFGGVMHRLSLILSIGMCLMAGFGLVNLMKPFISQVNQRDETRRGRRRQSEKGISREISILYAILIFLLLTPTVWNTQATANSATSLSSTNIYPGFIDWPEATNWMQDNIPKNSVVASWWDYGYWIETLAKRTTLADGLTLNGTHIAQIGKMLLLNETEALPLMKQYDVTHVVVHPTYNPWDPEQSIGHGDQTIWPAMARIAELNETEYYNPETREYNDKFYNSNLYKMMKKEDMDHFNLVFSSTYSFVLVYEIDYGES